MEAALITGSRSWDDAAAIDAIVSRYEFIVVGDAQGADRLAREAGARHASMVKVFAADWRAEPRKGGMIRNYAMVSFCELLQGDGILVHCHAFWDGQSTGTKHCASAAERQGIATTWHLAA